MAISLAQETGAVPSQQALAEATGRSVSTIQRAIKTVCDQGYRIFSKVVERLLEPINSVLTSFTDDLDLEACRQNLDAIGCSHLFGAVGATETVGALEREFKGYGQELFFRAMEGVTDYGRTGIDRAITAIAVEEAITAESSPPVPIPTVTV